MLVFITVPGNINQKRLTAPLGHGHPWYLKGGVVLEFPFLHVQLPSEGAYVDVRVCVLARSNPACLLSLCSPGCGKAGGGRGHADHRCLPERGRVQQEPCGPAAAGAELQGEVWAAGGPGLPQRKPLIALERRVPW